MKKNECICKDLSLDALGRVVIKDEQLLEKINGAVGFGDSANIFDFGCDLGCQSGCNSFCSHDEKCFYVEVCGSDHWCNLFCPGGLINFSCPNKGMCDLPS